VQSKDGIRTGEFGLWLARYLDKNSQYSIYYDHGDRQGDPNVAAIKGFYGQTVTNKNRLVDTDVIVVNNDNNSIVLLIEIEETEMSPKKLLGDVFATLMCNRFALKVKNKQKYFRASPNTKLIVAGVVQKLGDGQDKIENTITTRLQQFVVPGDAIQIDKITFVFGEDISGMLEKLEREMINIFTMNKYEEYTHSKL